MKRLCIVWTVLVLVLTLLMSCSPNQSPGSQPAPTLSPTSSVSPSQAPSSAPASTKSAREAQWQKSVEAAQKEGTMLVYSQLPAVKNLAGPLKQDLGVEMEQVTVATDLSARILSARRAGLYQVDVILSGLTPALPDLKPAGALDPLEPVLLLPEVTDPKAWYKGKIPFADVDKTMIAYTAYAQIPMAVNTDLVKPGEIKSYKDLLDPKWKGKILFSDPSRAGVGNAGFVGLYQMMGTDYLRELGKQIQILRDDRLSVDWVAHGKVAILIPPNTGIMVEFVRAGAPLGPVVPSEGTWLTSSSGNVALMNKAPHPEAAKVFINWLLTQRGQTEMSRAVGYQSARVDVTTEFVPSFYIRDPATKYIDHTTEENATVERPAAVKLAKELWADLLK